MNPRHLLAEIMLTRWPARALMVALALVAAVFGLLAPLFQREFLSLLTHQPGAHSDFIAGLGGHQPLGLLALALLTLMLSLIFSQAVIYLGARESFLVQRKMAQRLYDSTLQLRTESLKGRPIGEIVSVYTTDIPGATILLEQSLPQGLSIAFPLLLAPSLLVLEFGVPVSAIAVALGILLTLNFYLAFRQSKFFSLFKALAAERVGVVNEWIQNIRILRVLGWTAEFERRIFRVRENETANRIAMLTNGQGMNAISSSVTYALNVVLLAYLVYASDTKVEPAGLLTLLWIVAVFLTRPFRQLPWFFTFLFDGWTSIKRLQSVLTLQEEQARQLFHRNRALAAATGAMPLASAVSVRGLSYRVGKETILDDLSFDIRPGEFIAVVGEVGSGKTSLLLALMRECSATFADYRLDGENAQKLNDESLRRFFSFVPQEGFIMSSSLKENVLLDYRAVLDTDAAVLAALTKADFDPDREGLASGLATEIGERGVNLSGGQRQRISLSRVDVRVAPIMLLDDCLSAVDIHTEKRLLRDLFQGAWRKRTRVLVTHRLSVLRAVDRIFFLHNGRLAAAGEFTTLHANVPEFRDFTASLDRENEKTAASAGGPLG